MIQKRTPFGYLFVLFILFFNIQTIDAQCSGSINFFSQADLVAFGMNAPPCTVISGNVTISGADINDLSALSSITEITGSLRFLNNTILMNMDGLSGLTSIGGLFQISSNPALVNIDGLSGLTSVTGSVRILSNDLLSSLSDLGSLTTIGGDLQISGNPVLDNINDLSSLTSVTGDIRILSNDQLTSLVGLDNIDPTGITNLQITSNMTLSTCEVQSICDYLALTLNTANISGNATKCANRANIIDACIQAGLPVELLSFTGKPSKENIILNWETASERNNQGFDIEHSKDGNSWNTIGYQDGRGDSNQNRAYQFIVQNPTPGFTYYRLKQIDFDGNYTYSKTIAINWNNNTELSILITPNPVKNVLSLDLPSNFKVNQIQVFNEVGQQIPVPMNESDNRFSLDCKGLPSGLYMILLITDSERRLEKFIKG